MKNKSKLVMIIVIVSLLVIGVTYAMYRKLLYNVDVANTAVNLDQYIIYSKGTNISSGTLNPVSSYVNGNNATVTFYKSSSSPYYIYGHIFLDINAINSSTAYELKFTVVDNSTHNIIGEGSFYTYDSGDSVLAAYNIPLNATATTYTVYVWLDEELYDSGTSGNGFDIDIRCYATLKTISNDFISTSLPNSNIAANYIKYLYNSHLKTVVANNNINYNYAKAVSLMNDRLGGTTQSLDGGDLRYYGANPNNYVYFNCSDSSNPTSSTCELWRIVGVFGDRLKLLRNAYLDLGRYSWDTSASNVNNGNGINQWGPSGDYEGADLMRLLNPGYENESINNSLYWNRSSGTCYSGLSNATEACDFTETGLLSSAKELIDMATWYLGASNRTTVRYSNIQYASERSNQTGKGCPGTGSGSYNCNDTVTRTTTWNGYVGLIYHSDITYAVDFSYCTLSPDTSDYQNRCQNYILPGACTISPYYNTENSPGAYGILYTSYAVTDSYIAGNETYFKPSVYLKSNVVILRGNGTETNPYVLGLD